MSAATSNERMDTRQQAFISAYLTGISATKAAIKAGYSPNGASVQATRLLRKDSIRAALAKERSQLVAKSNVSKAWLVREVVEELDAARKAGASQAVARLAELLARLHGYIVEHKQVRVITSLRDLSDEELKAIAQEHPPTIEHEPSGVETGVDKSPTS